MSRFTVLLCVVVLVTCLGLAYSKPVEEFSIATKQNLAESFVEFLKQDPQLSDALRQFSEGEKLIRNRRQMDDVENVDGNTDLDTNTEGFFDRAARFVMEVLQRFLKWVNTDK